MRSASWMSALSIAALTSVSFLRHAAWGEEPKPRVGLPNLEHRLQSVRFFVVDGRIQAVASEPGVERETSADVVGGSQRDKLTLNTTGELGPAIQYHLTTGPEKVVAEISDGDQITITRQSLGDAKAAAVEFHQPVDGPLTLSVKVQRGTRELKGATIWHLFMADPELCRQHLVPLLDMFRSDWRLAETAQSIEASMLKTAADARPDKLRSWDALVADLASDRFAERQRAERELRAAGLAALPYLRGLERKRLDFEQWSRIQHIIQSSDTDDEDRPDTVATRLMADPQAWLALLDRPEEHTQNIAAAELGHLLGDNAPIEASAPEAVRKRQIESLRKRVEREASADPMIGG